MEKLGYHKRDILASRVEKARDSQEETKEVFASALEQFQNLVAVEGGALETVYTRLSAEYDHSVAQEDELNNRIVDVKNVAQALFKEWAAEIQQYSNPKLRRLSEDKLSQTKERYGVLVEKMETAHASLEPVLAVFKDNVLFLKHNLNARAIGSIRNELVQFESQVSLLLQSMDSAIKESDKFIDTLED